MQEPALPANEDQRLSALYELEILDTPPEEAFDRITDLAADIFDAPMAVVSLVDADREWFKACYGTDVRQADRRIAFCAHTILEDTVLVIEDAAEDPRFCDNPQVVEHGIRFYAGAPLKTTAGLNVGAFCIKDTKPRSFSQKQIAILERLAATVVREFELRLAAEKIVELNRTLARRNNELDEFSYVASHDLQEPLRKLVSFSKLLVMDLGGDLPPQARKDLDFITDAAQRMSRLVQDLLDLSRAGRSAMKEKTVAVDDCVDQALEFLASRIEEIDAAIDRPGLPRLVADPTMLTQLFQNLIGNALKFVSPDRRPQIRITAKRDRSDWTFTVQDNGIGIKPEYAAQIFTPFKRLHGRGEFQGTGIGLAICRKTVERHGGRIWVESVPGQGTSFRFTIPADRRVTMEDVIESTAHTG